MSTLGSDCGRAPSLNPGEGKIIYLFYSRVGDGGLSVTRINGYNVTHNHHYSLVYLLGITRPMTTREQKENDLYMLNNIRL